MHSNIIGRKSVMTAEVVAKLEQAFSLGCSDAEACFFAGINKASLYRYQEKNKTFCNRKEALKKRMVLLARAVVEKALFEGDKATARWYLEKYCKEDFQNNQVKDDKRKTIQIKVLTEDGKSISLDDYQKNLSEFNSK